MHTIPGAVRGVASDVEATATTEERKAAGIDGLRENARVLWRAEKAMAIVFCIWHCF